MKKAVAEKEAKAKAAEEAPLDPATAFFQLVAGAKGCLAFLSAGGAPAAVASDHRDEPPAAAKAGTKPSSRRFKTGDVVRLRAVTADEAQALQNNHGGINPTMQSLLGTDGHIVKGYNGGTVTLHCKGTNRSFSWVSKAPRRKSSQAVKQAVKQAGRQ